MTQYELGFKLGWSQPWVSRLEQGYAPALSQEVIDILEKTFEEPLDSLLLPYDEYLKSKFEKEGKL